MIKKAMDSGLFPAKWVGAEDTTVPWSKVVLGDGVKDSTITDEKCLRVVECSDSLRTKCAWLYIRRCADGRIKYSLCNAPFDTSLETLRKIATKR